jgi:hypothetical protein
MFSILAVIYVFFTLFGIQTLRRASHRLFWSIMGILLALYVMLLLLALNDPWLSTLPLLLQKNITLIQWYILGSVVVMLSVYFFYRKKRWHIVVLHLVFIPLFYYVNAPIYPFVQAVNNPKIPVTQETTLYSCACAAFSTLLKQLGIKDIGEKEACELMGTTRNGSGAGQIRYAFDKLGIPYHALYGVPIDAVHTPAILFVDRRGGHENHAVVYLGKENGYYRIYDPMEGSKKLSGSKLMTLWHGHGVEVIPR